MSNMHRHVGKVVQDYPAFENNIVLDSILRFVVDTDPGDVSILRTGRKSPFQAPNVGSVPRHHHGRRAPGDATGWSGPGDLFVEEASSRQAQAATEESSGQTHFGPHPPGVLSVRAEPLEEGRTAVRTRST